MNYDFFPISSKTSPNIISLFYPHSTTFYFKLYLSFIYWTSSLVYKWSCSISPCSLLSSSFIRRSSSMTFLFIVGFLIRILCLEVGGVDCFYDLSWSLMIFLFILCWKLLEVVFILLMLPPLLWIIWSILFLASPDTVFFYDFMSVLFFTLGKGLGSLYSLFSWDLSFFGSYLFDSYFIFFNSVTFPLRYVRMFSFFFYLLRSTLFPSTF